jgi:hypothetical protein
MFLITFPNSLQSHPTKTTKRLALFSMLELGFEHSNLFNAVFQALLHFVKVAAKLLQQLNFEGLHFVRSRKTENFSTIAFLRDGIISMMSSFSLIPQLTFFFSFFFPRAETGFSKIFAI